MEWIIVAAVVVGLLLLGWIANAWRLAARNNNVARRSPKLFGRGGPEVDEHNRIRASTAGRPDRPGPMS